MFSVMDTDTQKSRKHAHNARIRKELVEKAAPLFRAQGPENVGIDKMMARAGMTRGAFYAHFTSKEAVFIEALRSETPLLKSLERRVSQDSLGLLGELRGVFHSYLSEHANPPSALTCTLAGLAVDVARSTDEAKAAHEAMQLAVRVEVARGLPVEHDDPIIYALVSLSVGSATLAAAQRTIPGRNAVLAAGLAGVNDLLDSFEPQLRPAPPPPSMPAVARPDFLPDPALRASVEAHVRSLPQRNPLGTPPPRPNIPPSLEKALSVGVDRAPVPAKRLSLLSRLFGRLFQRSGAK